MLQKSLLYSFRQVRRLTVIILGKDGRIAYTVTSDSGTLLASGKRIGYGSEHVAVKRSVFCPIKRTRLNLFIHMPEEFPVTHSFLAFHSNRASLHLAPDFDRFPRTISCR